jgi:hypothetical protein
MEERWSSFKGILFNRVVRSFTVMAPVRQKIRELCEKKSSKHLESEMRQLSLEINHSCSSTQRVLIIYVRVSTL